MATPKKKHLIELMIEAGVKWPDGAEYAAQDIDCFVALYKSKPWHEKGANAWSSENPYISQSLKKLPSICRNWHQTIVTHEQYAEALAANVVEPAVMPRKSNQARESEDIPPSQPAPKYCASVMRQMPDNTIEQLTADYHAKAAEADRLQSVTDEALKAADDAMLALEKAGELLGLVISIDTKPKQEAQTVEPAQPEITDWRDLRVGDVIELTGSTNDQWQRHYGREMTVKEVYPDQGDDDDQVDLLGESGRWSLGGNTMWRFIHRP